MKVPFFDSLRQTQALKAELSQRVSAVLDSGQFILGHEVKKFEEKVAKYIGVQEAVGVASGSDALWMALLALDVGPGDEVITTPFTFVSTVSAIQKVGATPILADIDAFNLDPGRVSEKITKKTKAIIPVHLFGCAANMSEFMDLAHEHKLFVLEDMAQSFGTVYQGKKLGCFGDLAACSFYPTKNLGSYGDAGLVLTSNQNLADRLRAHRMHGTDKKEIHHLWGWNSRLDELQAALLNVKLAKIDVWIDQRIDLAERYLRGLEGVPIKLPCASSNRSHTYNQFVIHLKERDQLRDFLKKKDIGTGLYYPYPIHLLGMFKSLGYHAGDFEHAENAAKESLALPIFPEMTWDEQDYVIRSIKVFFK